MSALSWILAMRNKTLKFHSLSRRIVAQFCIFTLVLSAIYGMLAFLLLYNLEDGFIEREVQREAKYVTDYYKKNKQWPKVRAAHFSLHFSNDSLPDDMRLQYIEEPRRKEFYGKQGRHYHLFPFPEFENTYLLAEVSQSLLVRPVREGVITLLSVFGIILTVVAFIIA